ncbi:hypothetical protein KCU77_g4601, partial [Aureobasidium melanogenum]
MTFLTFRSDDHYLLGALSVLSHHSRVLRAAAKSIKNMERIRGVYFPISRVYYHDKRWDAILTKQYESTSDVLEAYLDQRTLLSSFVHALKHWKPQSISFLTLPGEIRNQIYRLIMPNLGEQYTELHHLNPQAPPVLLLVLLMQTCKQVQKEVSASYFRNITLSLRLQNNESLLSDQSALPHAVSDTLEWYSELDTEITDQFHHINLEMNPLTCKITNSKRVFVQLCAIGRPHSFTSKILTKISIAIRDNVIRSLATSPTGLLGFRHFAMVETEVRSLLDWHEWKKQESELQSKKSQEAPLGTYRHLVGCNAYRCYECYLITQAEKEGLPKLIPAVSFEDPRQIRQRLLWKRDKEIWRWRKAIEADEEFPEELMWDYEDYLTEQAEQEGMPRLIRAAHSPLDELEMY